MLFTKTALKIITKYLVRINMGIKFYIINFFNYFITLHRKQNDILYAFYDLENSTIDFSFCIFLVLADHARIRAGCNSLHIVIVPSSNTEGVKYGHLKAFKDANVKNIESNINWLKYNIVVPCCRLIPAFKHITVCNSRKEAYAFRMSLSKHIFPNSARGNALHNPEKYIHPSKIKEALENSVIPVPSIHATPKSIEYVNKWLINNCSTQNVITVTLRESDIDSNKDSNLKEWSKFIKSVDPNLYSLVILRDSDKDLYPIPKELKGFTIFHQAVWNIELRAALYELSYLNLFVNNGPCILCVLNKKARYLVFGMIPPGTSKEGLSKLGYIQGESWPDATKLQKFVWQDAKYEVIKNEFDEMCSKIEKYYST